MKSRAIVLNVDDNAAGRYAVSQMLLSAGFEVWEAETGMQALALCENQPDIVLLDVNMPDMNGFEVCKRIKSAAHLCTITVIHLSASLVRGKDRVLGLETGADAYLTEPISQAELLATVQSALRMREAEATQRFLAQASAVMAESLDVDESLTQLARVAVPFLGTWCIVDCLEPDGGVRLATLVHGDPAREPLPPEFLARFPVQPDLQHGVAHVLRTGKSEVYPAVHSPAIPLGEEHPALLRALGAHSYLCVPLIARGRSLGALTLIASGADRTYTQKDLALAEDLAARASLSLDNARLYQQETLAVRTRDNLLALVSHDLKNPLSSILMSTSLIERAVERGEVPQTAGKHTKVIQRSAARMQSLIDDLLDLASIEAGHLSVESAQVDVDALLRDSVEQHAPIAQDKQLRLTLQVQDSHRQVRGDSRRLQQVLGNLLGNAIKFTPAGGEIVVSAKETNSCVEIAVQDSGEGIEAAHVSHLFERFWRASHATREGAGLGLSIAKTIIEAHRGRIWVESEPGRGSTFFFTVPVVAEEAA